MKSIKNILLGCCLLAAPFVLQAKVLTTAQAQKNLNDAVTALKKDSSNATHAQAVVNAHAFLQGPAVRAAADAVLQRELGKNIAQIKDIVVKGKAPILVKGGASNTDAAIEADIQSSIASANSLFADYSNAQAINTETDMSTLKDYITDLNLTLQEITGQKPAAAKISNTTARANFVKQLDAVATQLTHQMALVKSRIDTLQAAMMLPPAPAPAPTPAAPLPANLPPAPTLVPTLQEISKEIADMEPLELDQLFQDLEQPKLTPTELAQREKAAIKIQTAMRQHLAKKTLKKLKEEAQQKVQAAIPPAPAAEPAPAQVDAQVTQAIADLTDAEKTTVSKAVEKFKGLAKIKIAKNKADELRTARAANDKEADTLIQKIAPILKNKDQKDIRIGSVKASIANFAIDKNKLSPAKRAELEKSIQEFDGIVNVPAAPIINIPAAPLDESKLFNDISSHITTLQSNINKLIDNVKKAVGPTQIQVKQSVAAQANIYAAQLKEINDDISKLTLQGAREKVTDLFNKVNDALKQLQSKLPSPAPVVQPAPAPAAAPAAQPAPAQAASKFKIPDFSTMDTKTFKNYLVNEVSNLIENDNKEKAQALLPLAEEHYKLLTPSNEKVIAKGEIDTLDEWLKAF